jgi:hypothetical protein
MDMDKKWCFAGEFKPKKKVGVLGRNMNGKGWLMQIHFFKYNY